MSRLMYDSVSPEAIPRDVPMVAGYVNGTWTWSAAEWAMFPNAVKVRIATRTSADGDVLDVEEGAAWPPDVAPAWARRQRARGADPSVYCNMLYGWPKVRAAFRDQGEPEPHYWVARYDNVRLIPAGAVAKQFAHPPQLPGHYDLSIVADHWPGVDGGGSTDDMSAEAEQILRDIRDQLNILGSATTAYAADGKWHHHTGLGDTLADMAAVVYETRNMVTELSERVDDLDGARLIGEGSITFRPEQATS